MRLSNETILAQIAQDELDYEILGPDGGFYIAQWKLARARGSLFLARFWARDAARHRRAMRSTWTASVLRERAEGRVYFNEVRP